MTLERSKNLEKDPQNVKTIDVDGIGTFRIVLSQHLTQNTIRELGRNTSVVALEIGRKDSHALHKQDQNIEQSFKNLVTRYQYETVASYARQHRIPIAAVDLPFYDELSVEDQAQDTWAALGVFLSVLAVTVLSQSAKDAPTMSRRSFLRGATALALTPSLYLAGPRVLQTGLLPIPIENSADMQAALQRVRSWQGFDAFEIRLRNLVMAHKLTALALSMQKEGKPPPKITMFVGAHHGEIIEALQMDAKEREHFITDLLKKAQKIMPGQYDELASYLLKIPTWETNERGEIKIKILNAPLSNTSSS